MRLVGHGLFPRVVENMLDAKVEWTGPPNAPSQYAAKARVSELTTRAWENIPGLSGFSGAVDANEAKGTLQLASRKTAVELPHLLAEPVRFDTLSGQVDWQKRGGVLSVNVASLKSEPVRAVASCAMTSSTAALVAGPVTSHA